MPNLRKRVEALEGERGDFLKLWKLCVPECDPLVNGLPSQFSNHIRGLQDRAKKAEAERDRLHALLALPDDPLAATLSDLVLACDLYWTTCGIDESIAAGKNLVGVLRTLRRHPDPPAPAMAPLAPGTCPECRGTETWGETSDCPECHGTGKAPAPKREKRWRCRTCGLVPGVVTFPTSGTAYHFNYETGIPQCGPVVEEVV